MATTVSGAEGVCVLVAAAVAGDQDAWNDLVGRYTPMIRNVARGYRLNDSDIHDVTQTVWLRCFQHLSRLREPRALPGWLKTTTQHEALRLGTSSARFTSMDPVELEQALDRADVTDGPGKLLQAEASQALRDALAELPADHRRLLTMLHSDVRPSYRDISQALGIPSGSIGPTRARSLEKLRRTSVMRSYFGTTGLIDSA